MALGLGDNIETIKSALTGVQELSVRFFRTRGDREGACCFFPASWTLVLDVSTDFGLRLSTPVDLSTRTSMDTKQKASVIEAEMTGRGQKLLDKLRAADSDPLGLVVVSPFAGVEKARETRAKYQFSTIHYRAKVKVTGLGSI